MYGNYPQRYNPMLDDSRDYRQFNQWQKGGAYTRHDARTHVGHDPHSRKSGCICGMTKTNKPVLYMSAWNASKDRGLIKLFVTEMQGLGQRRGEYVTDKGAKVKYTKVAGELIFTRTGQVVKLYGMINPDDPKLYLEQFNLVAVANCANGAKGGYFGRPSSKKK